MTLKSRLKGISKKMKDSHWIKLAIFAIAGFLANDLLNLDLDNGALRQVVDNMLSLL